MLKSVRLRQQEASQEPLAWCKTSIDPARVFDRQAVSGEVAAGLVFALGPPASCTTDAVAGKPVIPQNQR